MVLWTGRVEIGNSAQTSSRFSVDTKEVGLVKSGRLNVLGAVAGAITPLGFVELYGFHSTRQIGAILNASIAASAFGLTLASQRRTLRVAPRQTEATTEGRYENGEGILVLLFTTGLATMGMEVIWIRIFTPYLGPVVYSFAMILVAYLSATFVSSQAYRFWSRRPSRESGLA